jgi:hypothetical protein
MECKGARQAQLCELLSDNRHGVLGNAPYEKEHMPVNKKTTCLDAETLAALAHGTIPADQVSHVEAHLPNCSKCLGVVARAARGHMGFRPPAPGGDTVELPRASPARHRPVRIVAIAMSLFVAGGSATWGYWSTAEDT